MGILPLQRLSAVHLGSIAAMTGAIPISSCREPRCTGPGDERSSWAAHLGLLGGVHLKVKTSLKIKPPALNLYLGLWRIILQLFQGTRIYFITALLCRWSDIRRCSPSFHTRGRSHRQPLRLPRPLPRGCAQHKLWCSGLPRSSLPRN